MTKTQAPASGAAVRFHRVARALAIFPLLLTAVIVTPAGTLTGSVHNGTTHHAVSGAEVVLMDLAQGMTPVSKVKTDARGRFQLRNAAPAKEPMLIEVSYLGVPYYQTISPGQKTASIVVYNTTTNRGNIVVSAHAIMLKPDGSNLEVEEQYTVENQTQPPVAFDAQHGTFVFALPQNAQLGQLFAWAVGNLPTRQNAVDLRHNRKAINWPFRPGKSVVRFFYAVPYPSNQATLRAQSPYPATHVFLVAPPGVQVSSDGFSPVGSQNGFEFYARQSVAADTSMAISVSGALEAGGQNPSASAGDAAVSTVPGRYRKLVWIVAGAFAGLLLAGTLFWRGTGREPMLRAAPHGKPTARAAKGFGTDLEGNLNRVREEFLQLKRRRHGGTISEEDYVRERERAEQVLREILRD